MVTTSTSTTVKVADPMAAELQNLSLDAQESRGGQASPLAHRHVLQQETIDRPGQFAGRNMLDCRIGAGSKGENVQHSVDTAVMVLPKVSTRAAVPHFD